MNKKTITIIATLLIGIIIGQLIASLGYNLFPEKEKKIVESENEMEKKDNDEENLPKDEIEADEEEPEEELAEELPSQEDEIQKLEQEILAENQRIEEERRKEEERLKKIQETRVEYEENSSLEDTPVDTNSGIRTETRTGRLSEPKDPDRDFSVVRESKSASLHFETGYKESDIEKIIEYYEKEAYPDLTQYYNISEPKDVNFYFLSKKSSTGINVPLPTTTSDPDGFYSSGHIYIFPEEIMHNMKRIIRHEYTHHLNNHYYDGGLEMYMDEGMAFYIMNYYYMDENEKNTVANVYGVKSDYKTYHNSKYVFLVLDRVLKGDSNFPEYFKNLKDYTHAKAFEMTFGMTESEFEKVYNEYVK